MPTYTIDPELKKLAGEIIQQHRPELKPLLIQYMFRPEAPVSDGKTTAGMCIRVDDRNKTIHSFDFIIEAAKDVWDQASPQFRRALMDHELGHCGIRRDENGDAIIDEITKRPKIFIRRHDIEEFSEVLERHGPYHKGLREFLDAHAKNKLAAKKKKQDEDAEETS